MADRSGKEIDIPNVAAGVNVPAPPANSISLFGRAGKLAVLNSNGEKVLSEVTLNHFNTGVDDIRLETYLVTTNTQGDLTINFPTPWARTPAVSLAAVATSTTQSTTAEITALNSTSLSIRTWRTQAQAFGGLAAVNTQPVIRVSAQVIVTIIGE